MPFRSVTYERKRHRLNFLDKLGWPVETVPGHPILTFIRRCIHTRRIVRSVGFLPTFPYDKKRDA
jgi:hypothetical protein